MSNRSEVALSITHKLKAQILEAGKNNLNEKDYNNLYNLLTNADNVATKFYNTKEGILVYYRSIKWNLPDPDITLLMQAFHEADDDDFRYVEIQESGIIDEEGDFREVCDFEPVSKVELGECYDEASRKY